MASAVAITAPRCLHAPTSTEAELARASHSRVLHCLCACCALCLAREKMRVFVPWSRSAPTTRKQRLVVAECVVARAPVTCIDLPRFCGFEAGCEECVPTRSLIRRFPVCPSQNTSTQQHSHTTSTHHAATPAPSGWCSGPASRSTQTSRYSCCTAPHPGFSKVVNSPGPLLTPFCGATGLPKLQRTLVVRAHQQVCTPQCASQMRHSTLILAYFHHLAALGRVMHGHAACVGKRSHIHTPRCPAVSSAQERTPDVDRRNFLSRWVVGEFVCTHASRP